MTVFPDVDVLYTEAEVCEASEPRAADTGFAEAHANETRLRSMLEAYFEPVCVALRRLGVPQADLEDGAQQVFVVASQKLASIEKGRERAFLMGTAVFIASHARRTKKRKPEVSENEGSSHEFAAGGFLPDELMEQKQRRALLDQVLAAMPEELRVVLVLFELEELTMQEISLALDWKPGTVASRIRRSREVFAELSARAIANEKQGRRS